MSETELGDVTSPGSYPGYQPPEKHRMPSGAVFLLQRPQLMKMIRRGTIPNPLMETVNEIFAERDNAEIAAEAAHKGMEEETIAEQRREDSAKRVEEVPPVPETGETIKAGFSFGELTAWSCVAAPEIEMLPAVGETPLTENGKLSWDAISDADIRYLMVYAGGGVAEQAQFPAQPESTDRGVDGGEVPHAAEPPAAVPA